MEEIKVELRQDNIAVKANAVAKLTYVSTNINLYVFLFITMYVGIKKINFVSITCCPDNIPTW